MQCPRCRTTITATPDPGGITVCPGCGAKLTARAAGGRAAAPSTSPAPSGPHPGATLPPGTPLKKIPRPGEDTARSSSGPVRAPQPPAEDGVSLETLLAEIRAVRRTQEQILSLLRSRPAGGTTAPTAETLFVGLDEDDEAPHTPVRSQHRKSVLLIDDDPASRAAAVAELQRAAVPVVAVADGDAGVGAIAAEKPDVIVLELDLQGNLPGKDVINMIKATMDWVDIPIVLYTRLSIDNQPEARQEHGADEVVPKSSGPAALVSRVVALFRRA